jgi:hypothetical protein
MHRVDPPHECCSCTCKGYVAAEIDVGRRFAKRKVSEMPIGKWTEEDYDEHVRKVREALDPARGLIAFIDRHAPAGARMMQMPYALVSSGLVAPGEHAILGVNTYVKMRPLHLVLSEDTSKNFLLESWTIGKDLQMPGSGALPLDTFSVEYVASAQNPAKVLEVQNWHHESMFPGQKMRLVVKNESCESRAFRGLLWAACSWGE